MHSTKNIIKIILTALLITIAYPLAIYADKIPKQTDSIDKKIQLTGEEQFWLKNNPSVKFGYTASFEPLLIQNSKNELSGIAVDIFKIINKKLNTNFEIVVDKWPKVLEKVQNKEIDVVLVMKPSLADKLGLLKSHIVATDYPTFFIKRNGGLKIEKIEDIKGKTIAIIKSVAYADEILKPFKDTVTIQEYSSPDMPMRMVSEGEADLALALTSNIYNIAKNRYTNIDPTYTLWNYPVHGVMGIRPDKPILQSVLNKALASLSEEEKNAIFSKWAAFQYKQPFNYAFIFKIIGSIIIIMGFFTLSNLRLRRAVKKKAEELTATTVQYQTLFHSAKDAILIIKKDTIDVCNKQALILLGFEHENQLKGRTPYHISPPFQTNDKSSEELFYEKQEAVLEGNPLFFEWKLKKQNGIIFDTEVNLTPIKIHGKLCVLAVIRDITEKKKAKEELIKSKEKAEESDKLKTAFLASLSHEIRTPMNGILGFADLLRNPGLTETQKEEFVSIIESSGNRMLHIINDLIDISKIESGQLVLSESENSINAILDEIYTFFTPKAEEQNIILTCKKDLPDKKDIFTFDKNKLTQIIINLIVNAFKFTDSGTITYGYIYKENILEFYVKDTGIGIEKHMHEIIFESFRQIDITNSSKNEGSGLGLSISKAFVEKHGGKIWIDSDLNQGSTFYFTLPISNS